MVGFWCTSRKLVHTRVGWSGNGGFFGVQVGNLYIRGLVGRAMVGFWCTSRKLVHTRSTYDVYIKIFLSKELYKDLY